MGVWVMGSIICQRVVKLQSKTNEENYERELKLECMKNIRKWRKIIMMRIAVASDKGMVTEHFGHCESFEILMLRIRKL